ncbi:MAG: oxaloacetate decarboxylase [Tissierellales bacterium]|nr:oxaloacetate decarboxylase [Tissierellales bacterium]
MKKTTKMRNLINSNEILILPGAYDSLSAKIIEMCGFRATTIGGYAIAATKLAQPDVGYLSMTEMVNTSKYIANSISIPLLVDGDTGYGNAMSVMRTVQEYERAGVAAIFFEDQEWPKRCGHMEGKKVIPMREHCKKIEAAVYAKIDKDLVIVARTDARAVNGLEDAIERGKAYADSGADLIFVEAPQSIKELELIAKSIKAPKLVNVVENGKTPSLTAKEYEDMGYSVVAYPVSALYSVSKNLVELFTNLKLNGTTKKSEETMITFSEFNKLIGLDYYNKMQDRFL